MNKMERDEQWSLIEQRALDLAALAAQQQGRKEVAQSERQVPAFTLPTTALAHAKGIASYVEEVASSMEFAIRHQDD